MASIPSSIKGTGKDGRLTKEDVLAAAKPRVARLRHLPPAAAQLHRPALPPNASAKSASR
jgi:2-oxoglutarate dehydrogenase E2 component (dihydrolipoamide succinyltransferase)